MLYKIPTAIAFVLAAATPTFAQELAGASVSASYSSSVDSDFDNDSTALKAGIELALPGAFSLGGNIATFDSSAVADSGFNATLHGMYMLSADTSLGLFVSRDTEGDFDYDTWGIEGGGGAGGTRFEAYFGVIDGLITTPDVDTTMAGASIVFAAGSNFGISLGYDVVTGTYGSVSDSIGTTTLGGAYYFAGGPSIFAEIGQVSRTINAGGSVFVSADPLEFIRIGAEMNFGRSSGNLLGNRSVFNSLGY